MSDKYKYQDRGDISADLIKADLHHFEIGELLNYADKIDDAHLLILLNRLAPTLGKF